MNARDVEATLRRLEDCEEIRLLKYTYGRLIARMLEQRSAEEEAALARVFTEDAVGNFGRNRQGLREGRNALLDLFTTTLPAVRQWFMHFIENPLLEVNGDHARGEWMVLAPTQAKPGALPAVSPAIGRYVEEYRRTPQGWRIRRLAFREEAPQ